MKIVLKNVRLSFPSLFQTELYNGTDTEKYAATLLIDKEDAQVATLTDTMKKVAAEKFGNNIPKSLKWCIQDGDEKEYDGYAGCFAIKATTKRRPVVIDGNKTPIADEDGKIYAGCYVNASIDLWCMDNQYGKRVLASLNGVQFARDGDAFGNNSNSALSDFEEIEVTPTAPSDPFAESDDTDFPF